MTLLTPEEVVALAQRRIAERTAHNQREREPANILWRYLLGGLLVVLAVALIGWPGIPLQRKLYVAVHGVCAQVHNVALGGVQLPLCARNTGIYSAALSTILALWAIGRSRAARLPPPIILATLALAVAVMALPGLHLLFDDRSWPRFHTPKDRLRALTGIGAGTTFGVLLVYMFNQALRADAERDVPVVGQWRELAGVVALNGLVWLAIYTNIAITYWPVALLSWFGIVGTLFLTLLLPTAILMGYHKQIRHLVQLARPASITLLVTIAVLALLAILRFAGEGSAARF